MKKITFEEFNNETEELLFDYAQEHGLEKDELNENLVMKVRHLRSQQWINYKLMLDELK
jgi:hypothetical protein